MKKIWSVLIFGYLSLFSYSQTISDISVISIRSLQDSLEKFNCQLIELEQRIRNNDESAKTMNSSLDSIKNSTIQSAQNTIQIQNSLLDGFGTLYTYITIVVAGLGLLIPLLLFLLGIIPARRQIKKAKKIISDMNSNLDNKFAEYILRNREKQINSALTNLKSQDQFLRSSASNFLHYNIDQNDFSEIQLFEIYKMLKNLVELDEEEKTILANILCSKRNQYSEDYFREAVINEKSAFRNIALEYFIRCGLEKYSRDVSMLILDSEDPAKECIQLVLYLSSQAPQEIIKILNFEELIKELNMSDMTLIKQELNDPKYDSMRAEINNSLLYRKK